MSCFKEAEILDKALSKNKTLIFSFLFKLREKIILTHKDNLIETLSIKNIIINDPCVIVDFVLETKKKNILRYNQIGCERIPVYSDWKYLYDNFSKKVSIDNLIDSNIKEINFFKNEIFKKILYEKNFVFDNLKIKKYFLDSVTNKLNSCEKEISILIKKSNKELYNLKIAKENNENKLSLLILKKKNSFFNFLTLGTRRIILNKKIRKEERNIYNLDHSIYNTKNIIKESISYKNAFFKNKEQTKQKIFKLFNLIKNKDEDFFYLPVNSS